MPAKSQDLFFIALVPPEPINGELQKLKELFATEYQSKASLNSPPHITLHMPFKLNPKKQGRLIQSLKEVTQKQTSFLVKIENFKAFEPRVIYAHIHPSEELNHLFEKLSRTLQVQVGLLHPSHKNKGFTPHITLAFRDLRKGAFHKAWAFFQSKMYEATFEANTLYLLKHDGKKWDIYQEFSFGTS